MLDVKAGVVVGFEQPWVELRVDEDVNADNVETLAFGFREC